MSSQEQRSVAGSLGLFVASLALLGVGGFVQFDDTSGLGSYQWNLPLGALAAVLGVAGIGVASVSAKARLWLGGALGLLDVFLIWQSTTNDGFRFVWDRNEGQLFLFQVALGLVALVLIATGLQPSPREAKAGTGEAKAGAGRWLVRVAAYLCGMALAAYFGFFIGADQYADRYCTQVGACDADDLRGLVWGVNGSLIALGVCLVLIVAVELVLRSRRKQQRKVSTLA